MNEQTETQYIDKIFLELSQFTKSKTDRELELEELLKLANESICKLTKENK